MVAIGVGLSERNKTRQATAQALREALSSLGGAPPRGVMVFASPRYEHTTMLDEILRSVGEEVPLIGCTADATMTHKGYTADGLVIIIIGGEDVVVHAAVGTGLSQSVEAAARSVTEQCLAKHDEPPGWAVVLPDGLHGDKSDLMRAFGIIAGGLGGFPVFGGAASDEFSFECTYQFFGRQVLSDSVPMMTVRDGCPVGHGVGFGWCPIGNAYTVTAAAGATLLELDGERALDVISRTLGGVETTGLLEYPLAVCDEDGHALYLRSVLASDEETGGVSLVGSIPEGASVRFTIVRQGDILHGSSSATEEAISGLADGVAGALVFSCAARKNVLGTRVDHEHERIRDALGADTPWAGFYGYGELLATSESANAMHNITCVIAAIGHARALVS